MNIQEYQKEAFKRLNPLISNNKIECMNYACLGIIEETGEVIAELRKALYKGNFHEKELDKREITKECGDLIWYLFLVCKNNDINIEEIEERKLEDDNIGSRDFLVKKSLEIGARSSEIIGEILNQQTQQEKSDILKKKIQEQLEAIKELLSCLEVDFEEALKLNLRKTNRRYDEDGKAKKITESR